MRMEEDDESKWADLKTKRAWNGAGKSFSPDDINDAKKLDDMRASEPLWDDDLNELVICPQGEARAGRKATRAHFKLKAGQPRMILNRDSADPAHNDAIKSLYDALTELGAKAEIYAVAWGTDNKRADFKLWEEHVASDYVWHCDPGTRMLMAPDLFIQPDIVGFDSKRMNRTLRNPGVIIEVVHHHWPDLDTWKYLKSLSAMHYIVVFYFVNHASGRNNYASKMERSGAVNRLVASHYLKAGQFYKMGRVVAFCGDEDRFYQTCKRVALAYARKAFESQGVPSKK
ncbi:TPA: hypothetical protein ACGCFX_000233 [Stenotrophomonas maltophilia]